MDRFLENTNKLKIPIEEIDNVYIWVQMSNTQEVLLSSKVFYELMEKSFVDETSKIVNVLKSKFSSLNSLSYRLCDYITFVINESKMFNGDTCFCYMNNIDILNSLICHIAYTKHLLNPMEDSLSSLIINKIDEPERFSRMMDCDFLVLREFSTLPEHKYRAPIISTFLSRRSMSNKATLVYCINNSILIGSQLISKERARDKKFVDLSSLVKIFLDRRIASYRSLLSDWYSMMKIDLTKFEYSKEPPKLVVRQVNR